MLHVIGIAPYQLCAEKIVDELRQRHGFSQDSLKVLFPDNRGHDRLGFRPRTLPTGEQILEVVRFHERGRFGQIVLSVRTPYENKALLVEKVMDEFGCLWRTRQSSQQAYEPEFTAPEYVQRTMGGYLKPDYRV